MGKPVLVSSSPGKVSHTFVFSGSTVDEIAHKVAVFMAARGYQLEGGTKHQAVYGKGSDIAQFFLGPFVNRQKHEIRVMPEGGKVTPVQARGTVGGIGGFILQEGNVTLSLAQGISFAQCMWNMWSVWGGIISIWRVKKEYRALVDGLQAAVVG